MKIIQKNPFRQTGHIECSRLHASRRQLAPTRVGYFPTASVTSHPRRLLPNRVGYFPTASVTSQPRRLLPNRVGYFPTASVTSQPRRLPSNGAPPIIPAPKGEREIWFLPTALSRGHEGRLQQDTRRGMQHCIDRRGMRRRHGGAVPSLLDATPPPGGH